jgi:hypothetical protein
MATGGPRGSEPFDQDRTRRGLRGSKVSEGGPRGSKGVRGVRIVRSRSDGEKSDQDG